MKDVWNYKRLHRRLSRFGASVVACLLFWATKGSLNLEKEIWYQAETERIFEMGRSGERGRGCVLEIGRPDEDGRVAR